MIENLALYPRIACNATGAVVILDEGVVWRLEPRPEGGADGICTRLAAGAVEVAERRLGQDDYTALVDRALGWRPRVRDLEVAPGARPGEPVPTRVRLGRGVISEWRECTPGERWAIAIVVNAREMTRAVRAGLSPGRPAAQELAQVMLDANHTILALLNRAHADDGVNELRRFAQRLETCAWDQRVGGLAVGHARAEGLVEEALRIRFALVRATEPADPAAFGVRDGDRFEFTRGWARLAALPWNEHLLVAEATCALAGRLRSARMILHGHEAAALREEIEGATRARGHERAILAAFAGRRFVS